nr:hypothetical protein [Tanacetum cinerariifolium]
MKSKRKMKKIRAKLKELRISSNDKGKGKVDDVEVDLAREKKAGDDVDLVDADDVDLFDALDLENKVKMLEGDFSRLLKEKKAKEAELKANKEVIKDNLLPLLQDLELPLLPQHLELLDVYLLCFLLMFLMLHHLFPHIKGSPSLIHTVSSVLYVDDVLAC